MEEKGVIVTLTILLTVLHGALGCVQGNQNELNVTKVSAENGYHLRKKRQTSPEECQDKDLFWDVNENQCKVCTKCPDGQQSTAKYCGYGIGEQGRCVDCPLGHYRHRDDNNQTCHRISSCDPDAIVLANATLSSDTVCGDCVEGMGYISGHCVDCNRHVGAVGCPESPSPAATVSPAATESPSTTESPASTTTDAPQTTLDPDRDTTPVDEPEGHPKRLFHPASIPLAFCTFIIAFILGGIVQDRWNFVSKISARLPRCCSKCCGQNEKEPGEEGDSVRYSRRSDHVALHMSETQNQPPSGQNQSESTGCWARLFGQNDVGKPSEEANTGLSTGDPPPQMSPVESQPSTSPVAQSSAAPTPQTPSTAPQAPGRQSSIPSLPVAQSTSPLPRPVLTTKETQTEPPRVEHAPGPSPCASSPPLSFTDIPDRSVSAVPSQRAEKSPSPNQHDGGAEINERTRLISETQGAVPSTNERSDQWVGRSGSVFTPVEGNKAQHPQLRRSSVNRRADTPGSAGYSSGFSTPTGKIDAVTGIEMEDNSHFSLGKEGEREQSVTSELDTDSSTLVADDVSMIMPLSSNPAAVGRQTNDGGLVRDTIQQALELGVDYHLEDITTTLLNKLDKLNQEKHLPIKDGRALARRFSIPENVMDQFEERCFISKIVDHLTTYHPGNFTVRDLLIELDAIHRLDMAHVVARHVTQGYLRADCEVCLTKIGAAEKCQDEL